MKTHLKAVRLGAALFIAAMIFGFSATTWALGGLLDELPGNHNTVVLADIDQLRTSPFFLPTMIMARQNAAIGPSLREMEARLGINVQNDLQRVAIVTNGPPISMDMLTDPMAAIEDETSTSRATTVVVQGRFDANAILGQLSGNEEASSHVSLEGVELHRLDDNTLAMISGTAEYRRSMNQAMENRSGLTPTLRSAFEKLGQQGLYMITIPTLDESMESIGSSASLAGLGVHLGTEIRLRMLLTMKDEEGASASLAEFTALHEQAATNPLLGVFGLQPLMANLTMDARGADIFLDTSMTNSEARILIQRVVGYLQTASDLQAPLQPSDESTEVNSAEEGVNADFN